MFDFKITIIVIPFLDAMEACRFLSMADDVKKRLGKCFIHA